MSIPVERRHLSADIEPVSIQNRAGGRKRITGYAAVHYDGTPRTEYVLAPNMVERVSPEAFVRALDEKHDVRGLFNHSPDNLLGRTSAGTCRLIRDTKGLKYEIDCDPEDPDHQRVLAKINRGDLTGSSFAFKATEVAWEKNDGRDVRIVKDLTLYDVGPVTYPAYDATTTGLRSQSEVRALLDERDDWLEFARRRRQLDVLQGLVASERDEMASRRAKIEAAKLGALERQFAWSDYSRQPGDDSATLRRKLQFLKLL